MKGKHRLLIADDDEILRGILCDCFDPGAYALDVVDNSSSLKEKCFKNEYDLVLLDYYMPPIDGISAMNEIQQYVDIGFIVVTARNDEEIEKHSLNAGSLGVINKSIIGTPEFYSRIFHGIETAKKIDRLAKTKEETKNIYLAMGIISERFKVSTESSYEILRQQARKERIRLSRLSAEVIEEQNKLYQAESYSERFFDTIKWYSKKRYVKKDQSL